MGTPARPPRRLTTKGQRTRARIVEVAAALIYERGVTATTIEDVKMAAEVSGSQLYHYFTDKEALVRAVIDHQADSLVGNQQRADLGTPAGLQAWRDFVVGHADRTGGQGGCPLGSLGSQLAEGDAQARAHLTDGFERWSAALGAAMRTLSDNDHLVPNVDPDARGNLLAALQGGLLLAQVERNSRPLATAIDTVLALALA